jgi:hypothetical protein
VVRSVRVCDIKSWLLDYIDIEGTRFCSEVSHTRTTSINCARTDLTT